MIGRVTTLVPKTTLTRNGLEALAALGDPVRRDLYRAVAAAEAPIGRDDAALTVGIPRSTAAFHLDRLVEAGLLTTEHRRLSGRSGPGAGRPRKLYAAASGDLLASMPERHYELVGDLLASAAERADRDGTTMRAALSIEARATGAAIGTAYAPIERALTSCGYEPRGGDEGEGEGDILLENCPFHALASRHTALVCAANLDLVAGIAAGAEDDREARLEPRAGHCCVALRTVRDD